MDGLTPMQAQLFALQDLDYRTFHCKLMPTVDPSGSSGSTPLKSVSWPNSCLEPPEGEAFLQALPTGTMKRTISTALCSLGKSYSWVLGGGKRFSALCRQLGHL